EVQRSADGVAFATLATVAGLGLSGGKLRADGGERWQSTTPRPGQPAARGLRASQRLRQSIHRLCQSVGRESTQSGAAEAILWHCALGYPGRLP
nr:hypothetical protein [Tanacetum cinerariifolium]